MKPGRVRESIERLARIDDRGSGRDGLSRFDKNERVVPFPPEIVSEIFSGLSGEDLMAYPDQQPFYEELSHYFDMPIKNLLVTGGSDAGIKYFFEVFTNPGDHVAFLSPTYAMVGVYAQIYEVKPCPVSALSSSEATVESNLWKALENKPRALILTNPNQPTGTTLLESSLDEVLDFCDLNDIAVLLDEAYIEFSSSRSRLEDVNRHPSLLVARTFSKAWGLAGARLGFVAGAEENIAQLMKVKPLADLNVLALKAGCVLLRHPELVQYNVASVRESKRTVASFCKQQGLGFVNSQTNFVHVSFPESWGAVYGKLRELGVLTRESVVPSQVGLGETLRISLGGSDETDRLLSAIEKVSGQDSGFGF